MTISLPAFIGKNVSDMLTAPFWKCASTERQGILVMEVRYLQFNLVENTRNQGIGSVYKQKKMQHGHCRILKMSVNGVSMNFVHVSKVITIQFGCEYT